ncbi:TPR repeat-containing protein [Cryptosporidium felis]|nr:TPR repeat-containing protein [Cryptosporidium felis]
MNRNNGRETSRDLLPIPNDEELSPSVKEKGNEVVCLKTPEKEKEIRILKMQLDTNLSIAHLKLEDYSNAIHYAEKALEYDSCNLKALHHKSQALYQLSEYELCTECVELALKIEPENVIFKKLQRNALLKQRQYISKTRKISKKLFNGSTMKESTDYITNNNSLKNLFMKYCYLFLNSKIGNCVMNIISKIIPIRPLSRFRKKN